jgi:aryl sulfotransferase
MNGFYWLASYPKSGNTWLRLFLESLSVGGKTVDINNLKFRGYAASRTHFDRTLDIESADLTYDEITTARPFFFEISAEEAKTPIYNKTHNAWIKTPTGEPLFPPKLTLGAVYIVRDPRDVAVSLAHHVSKSVDFAIERMANPLAMMEMADQRISRQLPEYLFSWSLHVQSWLSAPISLHFLKYEDMLADPVASLGSAARFLGFDATPEKIYSAVDAVCFDRLRSIEEVDGFIERPLGADRFFRRGVAGGWQDSLTPDQVARIEADHGEVMCKLGYL